MKRCYVENCRAKAIAREMCSKHWNRWRVHGDPMICLKPTDPLGATGPCVVNGCDREAETRRMCVMHYQRWQKHGDPTFVRQRVKTHCSAKECDRWAVARGMCRKHYTRWRKHGDTKTIHPGGRPLKGETLSWSGVHKRLERTRGRASQFDCVDCGGSAREWSYDNADPDELHEYLGDFLCAYSLSLDHYEPRCTPCHRKFDLNARQQNEMETK